MAGSTKKSRFWKAMALLIFSASAQVHADSPSSADSIAKGRALFLANCTACHGNDAKSQVDVVSDAPDLTEPLLYRNGNTDADIETSIREGRGGVMPGWGAVFNNDESVAHLRNFLKSLWSTRK